MKIIFLDFDGVITSLKSHWRIDIEKLNLVKHICDSTGAKIVISSSWRRHTLEDTIKFVTSEGFIYPELIVGITDRLYSFSLKNGNKHYLMPRGVEIKHFIEFGDIEVDNYIILDDDSDMLYEQRNNFIHTDSINGISNEDVKLAIKILNTNN